MTDRTAPTLLPYSLLVGQEKLKLALELTYVAPSIGGVLISGQRGTGKSTAVRSFNWMLHDKLPITLPINATDDRVMGGWRIDELMINSRPIPQPGLLEEASQSGVLYIDEVNLLDDHIVNLILDAASTGHLQVERDGLNRKLAVSFALVGTMNPEEGYLRPQLLDRFGLMVDVKALMDKDQRRRILQVVLDFDDALSQSDAGVEPEFLRKGRLQDKQRAGELRAARSRLHSVEVPEAAADLCAQLGDRFQAAGHRGDYVMALAARAYAALEGLSQVTAAQVAAVAPMALQHRRSSGADGGQMLWTERDDAAVAEVVGQNKNDA
jgi:magnesium chelatase subunit I